ncbi:MAG: tRNA-dihydrouridine synthase family protein [Thermodesulfobacteriota bacterium]
MVISPSKPVEKPEAAPSLALGPLTISPPLILAPMAGVTHSALRSLIMRFGGCGLLSTEMLAARRLPSDNPAISPYLKVSPEERPLSYQLLVADPEHIPAALERVTELGAAAVDINLGCPAPFIRRQGAGSGLAEEPELVRQVIATARAHTSLPLSAKIRLGTSLDEAALRNFCLLLEGEGLDYLTVHARLHREPFARKPRWPWLAKVKEWLTIPVIANGGIFSVSDARRCLALSGADGLMLGRVMPARPWFMAELAHELYGLGQPPQVDLARIYGDYLELLHDRFAPERRLGRLKEFSHYFSSNFAFGHHLASAVQSASSLAEAEARAAAFFQRWQAGDNHPPAPKP